MERLIVALLLACAPWAQAQNVYKCTAGGTVSYQSEPCSSGPADRVWHAPPEVIDPAIRQRNAVVQQEMDRRSRSQRSSQQAGSWPHGAAIGMAADTLRCEQAKAERRSAFERLGNRRTFAQSRSWDDRVYNACK